jgi:response regulator RpfG family c-di-GMP phosphodiesterase
MAILPYIIILLLLTAALLWNAFIYTPKREKESIESAYKAVALALELRCPAYKGLTSRVVELSEDMGISAGLSQERIKNLVAAAYLRDIGLAAIPYEFNNMAEMDSWTSEQRETFYQHAEKGAEILESIPSLAKLAPIVRCHHLPLEHNLPLPTNFDIPTEARILKIASDYALQEKLYGTQSAQWMLREGLGSEYDPGLAKTLLGDVTLYRGNAQTVRA